MSVKSVTKKGVTFFINLKLRSKIALSTSLLLLASTILTLLFIYAQSKTIVQKNSYNENHQTVVQLANFYNEKLLKLMDLTHGIFENADFKRSLGNILWSNQYNYAIESTTLQSLFQQTRLKDRFLDYFFLYTDRGSFYEDVNILRPNMDFTKTQFYTDFEKNHTISWQISGQNQIFKSEDKVIPVIMNTAVEGVYDRAVLVLNLKQSEFDASLRDISKTNKASIYIINNSEDIVTSYEYEDYKAAIFENDFRNSIKGQSEGQFNFTYKEQKLYANYATIAINGWKIIIVQSGSVLLKDVSKLQFFVLLAGIISITLAGFLSIVIASTITRPINKLRNVMVNVQEGNLESRFQYKTADEIGELGANFNIMLDDIQTLISELEIEREKTQEEHNQKIKAEIKALQAQINPHFLYNTLDSIYWKAKMGENELVSDMIVSLSKLLRIGLSKGQDKISVISEIEHAKNYLYLQSNMYSNKFDYVINIDGDISKYTTVKLIIQPIIENSLLHGFEDIEYKGKIDLKVELRDDKIHFIITDNGKGIDVNAVEKSLNDAGSEPTGYALKNVYQRLTLNYGDKCRMLFDSEPFIETKVEIVIPAEEV